MEASSCASSHVCTLRELFVVNFCILKYKSGNRQRELHLFVVYTSLFELATTFWAIILSTKPQSLVKYGTASSVVCSQPTSNFKVLFLYWSAKEFAANTLKPKNHNIKFLNYEKKKAFPSRRILEGTSKLTNIFFKMTGTGTTSLR